MLISNSDLLLLALFSIGLFQFFWLSVILVRKGFNPSLIRLSMVVLLSIWVLIWPAFSDTGLVLVSLAFFIIPLLLSLRKNSPFARHLRLCWHTPATQNSQPMPWLTLLISLIICAETFQLAPELGLGLGLSFCLAWSAAELIDRTGRGLRLGFSHNPTQSLAGHLVLVLITSFVCAWSLQLYHGSDWQQFFIATTIVGLVGSVVRAMITSGWNMPLATLAMSSTLWLL